MHFNICIIRGAEFFVDVAFQCYYGLLSLGYSASYTLGQCMPNVRNIIYGAHFLPEEYEFSPGSIIYNFEHFNSPHFSETYKKHLCKAEVVWDYSAINAQCLGAALGRNIDVVFPGYVKEMTRIRPNAQPDIDMLFYGTENPRRAAILGLMKEMGLEVHNFKGFGKERDQALYRSSMVLNLHYYLPPVLEIARLGYIWANKIAVLCELVDDAAIPEPLKEACCYVPVQDLPHTAAVLLRKPELRHSVAQRGFEVYSNLTMENSLRPVVGSHSHGLGGGLALPRSINAGSGKNFMPNCLNIDINDQWNPDIVLDMSAPLPDEFSVHTQRFGHICLEKGAFAHIVAEDMLEHVPDLVQTMTNFMELLEVGGTLQVGVPYDLSFGAWQDPTHMRAFNERSWNYYTSWHWYCGWREFCFDLKKLEFVFSSYGKRLKDNNFDMESIVHTPRAVDAMNVTLCKRRTTVEEKMEYDLRHRTFYVDKCAHWEMK